MNMMRTPCKGNKFRYPHMKGTFCLSWTLPAKCGLTPQYKALQELYDQYHEQGLEILGFPSNQFAKQEPGSSEEISEFCQINYGVTFPMFAKTDVNGDQAHPYFVTWPKLLRGIRVQSDQMEFY